MQSQIKAGLIVAMDRWLVDVTRQSHVYQPLRSATPIPPNFRGMYGIYQRLRNRADLFWHPSSSELFGMSCTGNCNQGRNCDCGAVFQYHQATTLLLILMLAAMILGSILAKGILK